jgi:hypothetical protein
MDDNLRRKIEHMERTKLEDEEELRNVIIYLLLLVIFS